MATITKLRQESAHPLLNKAKWVVLFVLFFAALFANYHFVSIATVIRLAIWIVLALVLFGLFLWTEQGGQFLSFAKAARNEMRKVVWPTRQETIQSSIAVVVLVAILALLLWLIDSFWFWLITLITG